MIRQKAARHQTLPGIQLQPPAHVYAERPAIHHPTDVDDSYVGTEHTAINRTALQRYTVDQDREARTFYVGRRAPLNLAKFCA